MSRFGNGLTGNPASYDAGTAPVDRVAGNYPEGGFVEDAYDISELAGVAGGVLRFTYATDPGLAKLGWVIDDLVVKAGDQVLFESDFEDGDGGSDDPRVYNGGCKEDLSTSGGLCTEGWSYLAAGTPSELEHGYVMEMRDRSGFDLDGRGESDRGPTAFEPGLLLDLHRRGARLRQRRHGQPAGADAAGLGPRARGGHAQPERRDLPGRSRAEHVQRLARARRTSTTTPSRPATRRRTRTTTASSRGRSTTTACPSPWTR